MTYQLNPFKFRALHQGLILLGSPHSAVTLPYHPRLEFLLHQREVSAADLALLTDQERAVLVREHVFIDWTSTNESLVDRQLGFFSLCGDGEAEQLYQDRLAGARVAVLGVGGLGSQVAYILATAGVGELVLCDYDVVERSNLNRQILYTEDSLGQLKVDAAQQALSRIAPQVKVSVRNTQLLDRDTVAELVRGCDVVVRAVDQPFGIAFEIDEACRSLGIPHIGGGFVETVCTAGPFCTPESVPLNASLGGKDFTAASYYKGPVLGPLAFWLASYVTSDIIRYLTRVAPPQLLDRAVLLDWLTGRMFVQDLRLPQTV
ncbi:HesA/MoeB/ThiF family protein [Deinococcus aquiradiocola]|nr:ThiF family adenylyltransferase [Deinococcus aquiradiocola]